MAPSNRGSTRPAAGPWAGWTRPDGGPLVATLEALPAAVGVGESRRYLVVLTSPAELRPAGGVPLAAREVVLDKGVVDLGPADTELAEALRDTGTLANSPTTGKAMLRAAQARGRPRPDGVIVLDPLAMRKLLEATGPVAVPGYGRIDAADAVAKLTRDADLRWPDRDERRRYHQAVLATLVTRFLSGNDLVATGRVLGAAGPGRNVQVYAADPGLQRMLAGHRLDGALADPGTATTWPSTPPTATAAGSTSSSAAASARSCGSPATGRRRSPGSSRWSTPSPRASRSGPPMPPARPPAGPPAPWPPSCRQGPSWPRPRSTAGRSGRSWPPSRDGRWSGSGSTWARAGRPPSPSATACGRRAATGTASSPAQRRPPGPPRPAVLRVEVTAH